MSKYDMYGKFHLDLHSNEIKIKKIKYITSYFLRAARPSMSAALLQIALYYNTNGTKRRGNEAEHYVKFSLKRHDHLSNFISPRGNK